MFPSVSHSSTCTYTWKLSTPSDGSTCTRIWGVWCMYILWHIQFWVLEILNLKGTKSVGQRLLTPAILYGVLQIAILYRSPLCARAWFGHCHGRTCWCSHENNMKNSTDFEQENYFTWKFYYSFIHTVYLETIVQGCKKLCSKNEQSHYFFTEIITNGKGKYGYYLPQNFMLFPELYLQPIRCTDLCTFFTLDTHLAGSVWYHVYSTELDSLCTIHNEMYSLHIMKISIFSVHI